MKEKMKVRSHVKHKWHSCVIFLLVMKALKLSLKVVYYDRNMYRLYKKRHGCVDGIYFFGHV